MGLCEFAPNRLIISTKENQLMLFDNLDLVWSHDGQEMTDRATASAYLAPFLGFDAEKFPFVAWARDDKILLINVNEAFVEPIVEREYATFSRQGQDAFFFKDEVYGASIHFPAKCVLSEDQLKLAWCKMSLKPDFYEILRKYGTIPAQTTAGIVKLMQNQA